MKRRIDEGPSLDMQAEIAAEVIANKDASAWGLLAVLRAVASGYCSNPVGLARRYLDATGVQFSAHCQDAELF